MIMNILVEEKYYGSLVKSGIWNNKTYFVASDICGILRIDKKWALRYVPKKHKDAMTIERNEPNEFMEMAIKRITVDVVDVSGLAILIMRGGDRGFGLKAWLTRTYLPLIRAHYTAANAVDNKVDLSAHHDNNYTGSIVHLKIGAFM